MIKIDFIKNEIKQLLETDSTNLKKSGLSKIKSRLSFLRVMRYLPAHWLIFYLMLREASF